jgi:rhodanese-related sulfurtransferase
MQKIILSILVLLSLNSGRAEDVLIDVREKEELSEGMLPGAKSFPLSRIKNEKNWKQDFLKMTEGKDILLYCRSGRRSGMVQEILKQNNIASKNIGGYEELKDKFPVSKKNQ